MTLNLLNPAWWWRRRRRQRGCFHHNPRTGETFIDSALIDTGMRKMWWCKACDQCWFTP